MAYLLSVNYHSILVSSCQEKMNLAENSLIKTKEIVLKILFVYLKAPVP